MSVNMQKVISEFRSGVSIKTLAQKYNMSEKQLNDAIQRELLNISPEADSEYKRLLAEHNKKVDEQFGQAFEKFKSGRYMDALKCGLNAAATMLDKPENPNLITGVAPCPMKLADFKSIISMLSSLKNLPQIISKLKTCKSFQQFKDFITKLAKDLKSTKVKGNAKTDSSSAAQTPKTTKTTKTTKTSKTHAQIIEEYSKGKNLINMTDEELVLYYKKLVPDINREELKYLVDQMHRVKRGEPRWLNTTEENHVLRQIADKFRKHKADAKITTYTNEAGGTSKCIYNEAKNPRAEIPFKKKELTDFQHNQLSGWYNKGHSECLKPVFEDLGTVLDRDVYLYRCVTVRADSSLAGQQRQCSFLNSIKEGGVIDNGVGRYTSASKDINGTLDYSMTFGQSYILKIKVPKGTKVLDMRNYRDKLDEIVLPPSSYKVNKIDYTTGIVDCDFIPK